MDELIKGRMEEGETILWQGGTEAIEALDKTNKKRFWVTLAICAVLAVVINALYITNVKGEVKPAVIVIILLLCAFAPLRRILDASAVRKLRYVVTDKRLMIVSTEAKAVLLSRIPVCALRSDEDGHLSFLAGENALKAKSSHWRDLALTGQPNSADADEPVDGVAFYAVADKAGLRKVIRQVLPQVQD